MAKEVPGNLHVLTGGEHAPLDWLRCHKDGSVSYRRDKQSVVRKVTEIADDELALWPIKDRERATAHIARGPRMVPETTADAQPSPPDTTVQDADVVEPSAVTAVPITTPPPADQADVVEPASTELQDAIRDLKSRSKPPGVEDAERDSAAPAPPPGAQVATVQTQSANGELASNDPRVLVATAADCMARAVKLIGSRPDSSQYQESTKKLVRMVNVCDALTGTRR